MPIFHLSMKAVQRSAGRSAAASAAYRSGQKIHDPRQGKVWEYKSRSERIVTAQLVLPPGSKQATRQELWAEVETSIKRKDACTAREVEVALPHDLDDRGRVALAIELGKCIADLYGVAADVSVHKSPGEGGNWHAHILCTANTWGPNGLGSKMLGFDPHECGKRGEQKPADILRPLWADNINRQLERAGVESRVDHRTLFAQGIDRQPTEHVGVGAGAEFRRERNRKRKELQALEAEFKAELAREAEESKTPPLPPIDMATREVLESMAKAYAKNMEPPTKGERYFEIPSDDRELVRLIAWMLEQEQVEMEARMYGRPIDTTRTKPESNWSPDAGHEVALVMQAINTAEALADARQAETEASLELSPQEYAVLSMRAQKAGFAKPDQAKHSPIMVAKAVAQEEAKRRGRDLTPNDIEAAAGAIIDQAKHMAAQIAKDDPRSPPTTRGYGRD